MVIHNILSKSIKQFNKSVIDIFSFNLPSLNKRLHINSGMANSKFDYVKHFESQEKCLPNCWIIVRVDGKGFHRFSEEHKFQKPNDIRSLNLMTTAAKTVMREYRDVVLAYGQSDEYSFVFRRETEVYNRRSDKLLSYICSLFSSSYVYHWPECFEDEKLKYPPSFDARIVLYPTDTNLRDYISWRQVDTHINNLYNTCFWNLVQRKHLTNAEAEEKLRGTFSADKNEMLFQEFGINYNNEPEQFRKGTTLLRLKGGKLKQLNVDMIGDAFWRENSKIIFPTRKDEQNDNSTQTNSPKPTEVPDMPVNSIPFDNSTQTSPEDVINVHSQTVSLSEIHIHTQTTKPNETTTQTQTIAGLHNSTQTSSTNPIQATQHTQTSVF